MTTYQNVVLNGTGAGGSAAFAAKGVEFSDQANQLRHTVQVDQMLKAFVSLYGNSGQLQIVLKNGKSVQLDGFVKEDLTKIKQLIEKQYSITCDMLEHASDGGNFGDVVLNDSSLQMNSAKTGKTAFELKLHNVSQCVLPGNSKDEVEIQFYDNDEENQQEDGLVQIRMRFPGADEEDEETPAEIFQKRIMERGMIRSVTGDVIAEFTEEQGTFLAPRGRYAIQMYSTFLRMHGAKYDYKITYEDIGTIYLLHRPDQVSSSIVISLEKPIRQGNQKYPYLVLQSNRMEHTMEINLSEQEIAEKYDGMLKPEMTMAMDSLVATVFKVLAQSKVLITRHFKSDQGHGCIKCSLKQNDGLLYPFEKSIIFIHKPTVLIRYRDVETVEYGRYKTDAHSATKNFDLKFILKPNLQATYGDVKEFEFAGIERQEFSNLHTFLKSRKMNVEEVEVAQKTLVDELAEGLPDDEDEEDDDYNSDNVSQSSGGSGGGSDSESYASDEGGGSDGGGRSKKSKSKEKDQERSKDRDKDKSKSKKRKAEKEKAREQSSSARKSKASSSSSKQEVASPPAKKKKDKNAPKGASSAYILFGNDMRGKVKEDHPDMAPTEIMRELGVRWKAMSAEDKVPYEERAAEDKGRAKDELEAYQAKRAAEGAGSDSDSAPKKKRTKKDKDAPKGASSAYILFGNDMRGKVKEDHPDMAPTEIMRELGVRWKAMSAEDKVPYEERAAEDKTRAQQEMGAYKAKKKAAEGSDDEDEGAGSDDAGGEDNSDGGSEEGSDNDASSSGSP